MAVTYRRWDADDRVSAQWHVVLSAAARRRRVPRHRRAPDDGEQAARYATYQRFGRPVAARPSASRPAHPHGRHDHAIDVNALDGGAGRLAAWLRRHGVGATFPVPGEALAHRGAAARPRPAGSRGVGSARGYPASERHWIRAYDRLRALEREGRDTADVRAPPGAPAHPHDQPPTAIRRAAEQSGWDQLRRRDRYRSLEARTR